MKRSLVKGRNGGKQRHSCVACGKCDHRLETCTSRAAKEIRKLKRQLADACSRQTGCAKKKQRGRENRKDKHYKSEAKWKYSGKTGEQKRDRKRKRQDVLRTRELLRDPRQTWDELRRLGYTGDLGKCKHCGKKTLVLSNVLRRGSNPDQLHASCQSCGGYVNVLYFSAFRGTKLSPGELLESVEAIHLLPIMQRPTADSLARATGLGRRALASVGLQRNKAPLRPHCRARGRRLLFGKF